MPTTTLFYAGLFGLFMAVLSIRVPMRRAARNIPWGDGGDSVLATRSRVFGNFTEYVPAILLLMALLELSGSSATFLHVAGGGLVLARITHAVSLKDGEPLRWRQIGRGIGAMGTWLILVSCAVHAIHLTKFQ